MAAPSLMFTLPLLALAISSVFTVLSLVMGLCIAYLVVAAVGLRQQRFRPAAVSLGEPTHLASGERKMLEKGHAALEKVGFRYAFCLLRRHVAVAVADGAECYYLHSGFDAVAVLSADTDADAPRIVFRSYRPDGWCLETHPSPPPQPLPRPINVLAWVPTKTEALNDLWQSHLAQFKSQARGAAALLPEPAQLIAHEQKLADEELRRHVMSGLLEPTAGGVGVHRFTWSQAFTKARATSPRALFATLDAAGISLWRIAMTGLLIVLLAIVAGIGYAFSRASDSLRTAQAEAAEAKLPQTLAELSDAMSPTERRTVQQGAWWWGKAVASNGAGSRAAALRDTFQEQAKAGSAPPEQMPKDILPAQLSSLLDAAHSALVDDLAGQSKATDDAQFQAAALACAALLRDTHWSLHGETPIKYETTPGPDAPRFTVSPATQIQATRRERLLALLTALEQRWQTKPPTSSAFTTQLLATLPSGTELQRDAAAACFVDKLEHREAAASAAVMTKFLRDSTPLGSVSMAGRLRSEIALWQAIQSQRPWSAAALLPYPEQEGNLIAQLHQLPSIEARRTQLDILATYTPRRSLCTAAIAAHLLMQQLPQPAMYTEPLTRALAKLSGTGPGIEIITSDPQQPLLQVTVPTVPPRQVQWQLKPQLK
jgi:hypothetical protein